MILLDPDAYPLIAHRGASGEYPENTLPAFQRALEQGADALELDVRLTADGVVVVLHDGTVDRTTDGSGAIAAMSFAAVKGLDAGRGQRVPALADLLDTFPTTPLIVDLKDVRAATPVRDVLTRGAAQDRVLVGAFRGAATRGFRAPPFHRSPGRAEVARFWLAARFGRSPVRLTYAALCVPEYWRGVRVIDARFLALARRERRPVHVWTVDAYDEAVRLRALGVCGIITDYPQRMRGLPRGPA